MAVVETDGVQKTPRRFKDIFKNHALVKRERTHFFQVSSNILKVQMLTQFLCFK